MTAGGDPFVGQKFSLIADYDLKEYLSLNATFSHFVTNAFLSDNPPAAAITYGQVKMNVQF